MGFASYLKNGIWDCVFCFVAASALSYTVFSGFYATQPLQAMPWLIAVACAVVQVVLFCVSYNLRTAVTGGILFGVALIAGVAVCAFNNPGATPVDDVEGNYAIAVLAVAAVNLAVFLLSRKYAGAVFLLVAGSATCALLEYLYWYGHLIAELVFLVGSVGLVVLKGYQKGIAGSDTDQLAFMSVSVVAIALVAISIIVGFGVYKLIVEPMEPPSRTITLFVENRRSEEVEIVGTGAFSSDTNGDSGNEANGDEEESDNESSDFLNDVFQTGILSVFGLDETPDGEQGATTALQRIVVLAFLAILFLALLIAAIVGVRKFIRRRRFRRMLGSSNDEAVQNLYRFFLGSFSKMKFPDVANLTLREYFESFKSAFMLFERYPASGAAHFGSLTDTYVRSVYGGEPMSDGDKDAFVSYYRVFYKNARSYVGRIKYLAKFFTM